ATVLRSALELRYQVYCLECNFLPAEQYPEGVESDEHDDAAAHFYSFDERSELVGYVRLVRADAQHAFPIQHHCPPALIESVYLPSPRKAAEVSRLMLRQDYRCRLESRQILLDLYKQMYVFSRNSGIEYWYAAMERTLARSLLRMNFAFRCIGPETDYYGPVAPYIADLRQLEEEVAERSPDLATWMQESPRWLGNLANGNA
ncbi:MAG: GNAT family N-acetyltransferase, partial [Burkholderiaceae bacterium]|nr:GNAT family N-acetyltransferase [Burkholderiaceae bacterium]